MSQTASGNIKANNIALLARPDGYLNVRADPASLIYDTFETIDTVNVWTLGGSVLPTNTVAGQVVFPVGTTASASSFLRSQPTFEPGSSAFLQFAALVTLDAAVVLGSARVWGIGIPNNVQSMTAPISNGVVFEVGASDGLLYGRAYSNGVKTQEVLLPRPTDGAVHRYQILYKASRVYFSIDNLNSGTIAFPNPMLSEMPVVAGLVNGTGAGNVPTVAPTLTVYLLGIADTGANQGIIRDSEFPFRAAVVTDPASIPGALVTGAREQGAGGALGVNINALQKATYYATAKPNPAADVASALQTRVSLHHLASSTKTVRIRRIKIGGSASATASFTQAEVHRITTAPAGAAVTPLPADGRDAACEATFLNTSNATSAGLLVSMFLAGSSTAATHGGGVVLYDWQEGGETKPLTLRAGVLEGIAVGVFSTAATTWTLTIEIVFTEE